MTEKVATPAVSKGSAAATAVKVGLFLFALTRFGSLVFGTWWNLTTLPVLRSMLETAQLSNLEATLVRIMGLALFPFNMALLAVLAPLFGWWIYSRVDKARQDVVGWLSALFFVSFDLALTLVFAGVELQLGYTINLVLVAIFEAIVILWLMFFMGIGFNIAKLLKSPL